MTRHGYLAALALLLSFSVQAQATETLTCPINEATGDDRCIYSRHIVLRETEPPKIKVKGKVVSLRVVSRKVLHETKPFPGLVGHKEEINYEGLDTTVRIVNRVLSNSCYEANETGELVEAEKCCGAQVQKYLVIRHFGEEIKFSASVWNGS